ncbi:MAG: carboxypeptidase-like regulatory domain-containing protein [Cyanobacteriota bacterium]|nr:carboxypeptidase-like regulatory domain-containing protein [Cyanobacteriota bacterium]
MVLPFFADGRKIGRLAGWLVGGSLWVSVSGGWVAFAQTPTPPPDLTDPQPLLPRLSPTLAPLFPTPATPPPLATPYPSPPVSTLASPAPPPPLANAGRLVGQVLNPVGQPIAQAQVRVNLEETGSLPPPEAGDPPAQTDERGGFELTNIPPGRWTVTVWHPDYETQQTEIWIQAGLTTPIDVMLQAPLVAQPQTRLGVLGVGGLEKTQLLGQRLAIDSLRLGLIPQTDTVIPLDNRKLQPILQAVEMPLYDLFERDRLKPEAVKRFFEYLGLQAIVIGRVDVLSRSPSASEISLNSRSRLELWTFDAEGNLSVRTLAEASRSQTEKSNLNSAEIAQLYQIQVTQMTEEVGNRWQENNPLASYFDPQQTQLAPQPSRLDTTVELRIPAAPPTPSPSPSP